MLVETPDEPAALPPVAPPAVAPEAVGSPPEGTVKRRRAASAGMVISWGTVSVPLLGVCVSKGLVVAATLEMAYHQSQSTAVDVTRFVPLSLSIIVIAMQSLSA